MRLHFLKNLTLAAGALGATSISLAQSSVTLFGVVDAAVTYKNNNGADGSVYGLTHSGSSVSRLGFRGVEDLGGGLKVGFWLEGALNNDTGNGGTATTGFDFRRESTVRISSDFGEVRLGRELTPTYRATSRYNVFGQVGIARNEVMVLNWSGSTTADANAVRQNNMISYYSPRVNGFMVSGGYGFDEQTKGSEGRYMGGVAAYDNGPMSLILSYERRNIDAGGTVDQDKFSFGGSYDLKVVNILGLVQQHKEKNPNIADRKVESIALSITAPVGTGVVKLQYALYDQKNIHSKAHHLSLGYVHNLSKRTALYGTVSQMNNKNRSNLGLNAGVGTVPGAGNNQSGMQVGVSHAF